MLNPQELNKFLADIDKQYVIKFEEYRQAEEYDGLFIVGQCYKSYAQSILFLIENGIINNPALEERMRIIIGELDNMFKVMEEAANGFKNE